MSRVNEFYPVDQQLQAGEFGAIFGIQNSLMKHLQRAKEGNVVSESVLCNRVGQLRRNCPEMPQALAPVLREVAAYLGSVGRKFDFANANPALWISQRNGAPRW